MQMKKRKKRNKQNKQTNKQTKNAFFRLRMSGLDIKKIKFQNLFVEIFLFDFEKNTNFYDNYGFLGFLNI